MAMTLEANLRPKQSTHRLDQEIVIGRDLRRCYCGVSCWGLGMSRRQLETTPMKVPKIIALLGLAAFWSSAAAEPRDWQAAWPRTDFTKSNVG
jgi:hypothetical protein